jgi:hypothetical protein
MELAHLGGKMVLTFMELAHKGGKDEIFRIIGLYHDQPRNGL